MAQTNELRPLAVSGPVLLRQDGPSFVFDASITETSADEFEVTNHPVESGVDVSDHIERRPAEVNAQLIVTNSPLDGTNRFNRDLDLYETLLAIARNRELFILVTGLRVYPNMVIRSISVTRDARTGQMVPTQVAFREVRLAQVEEVELPPEVVRRNGGRQNAEVVANAASAAAAALSIGVGAAASEEADAAAEKETSELFNEWSRGG